MAQFSKDYKSLGLGVTIQKTGVRFPLGLHLFSAKLSQISLYNYQTNPFSR